MTTIMTASRQWMSRPADERFVSLHELGAKVGHQRSMSRAKVVSSKAIGAVPVDNDPQHKGLAIVNRNNGGTPTYPTHWSFGQLASLAGAPAGYLRTLPAPVAADCINYGFMTRDVEDTGLLFSGLDDGSIQLRAATGPNYGRIWNADLVDGLIERFGDGLAGNFRVPGEFGKAVQVTKANTTIYGSDRDVFVFLADETNRVEIGNRRNGQPGSLARGFYVWNSEVGSGSIGAAFFLFDYVCCNRIIWGAQEFKEIRLRHTSGAPDRWLGEITPVLLQYANSAAAPVAETIKAAQAAKVDADLNAFLKNRFGLSGTQATAVAQAHIREEGRPIETLWDVATGITAHAKTIDYQNDRVVFERIGGKVLDLVAA